MMEFDKILNENEKILWEGRPDFKVFFLPKLIFNLFILIGLIIFIIYTITSAELKSTEELSSAYTMLFILTAPFWLMPTLNTVYNALLFKHLHYTITDKRVILQMGIIGRDFKSIDFDKITNIQVSVGPTDKLFNRNTGDIIINTGDTRITSKGRTITLFYKLAHIYNPYEVFKFIKQVSFDVKSDIEYPNQLRPQKNKGYQTDYSPENKPNQNTNDQNISN